MRLSVAIMLSGALFGCASVNNRPATFQVEPKNRATFSPGRNLPVGAVLKLQVSRLAKEEDFLVNRCGEPCNTSKVVAHINGELPPKGDYVFQVAEAGQYYLWMQKHLDNGEAGPVFIDKFKGDASSFYATFQSGTVVTGSLSLPSN
jgi:hypothetical protein